MKNRFKKGVPQKMIEKACYRFSSYLNKKGIIPLEYINNYAFIFV